MMLYLRRATIEDAEDVLRWRNDPTTRENSFTKDEIDLESHLKWFEKKLGQENCFMYILMENDNKAGNIRVDVEDGQGEISYMIAPDFRGKGYGKKIIGLVEETLAEAASSGDENAKQIRILKGLTLKENVASGKCFVANGYECSDDGDSLLFTKENLKGINHV